jgi:hypothetical protein
MEGKKPNIFSQVFTLTFIVVILMAIIYTCTSQTSNVDHASVTKQPATMTTQDHARPISGMWYVGIDMCGSGQNASNCVNGLFNNADAESYVNKELCELNAQQVADALRGFQMNVKRVWCEKR